MAAATMAPLVGSMTAVTRKVTVSANANAKKVRTSSSSSSKRVVAIATAAETPRGNGRRDAALRMFAGVGAVAMTTLAASPAFALLPDDEDEELVAKAIANRKNKIEQEKLRGKQFVREAGFKEQTADVLAEKVVQSAVTNLYDIGQTITAGDATKAAAAASGAWVAETTVAMTNESVTASDRDQVTTFTSGMASLARAGSAKDAKVAFVSAANALGAWCKQTGFDSKVVGL